MTSANPSAEEASLRSKAKQAMDTGEWPQALVAFDRLARLRPDDIRLHWELADLNLRLGKLRAATDLLVRAAKVLPNDAPLIAEFARRLAGLGEIQAARRCAEQLERAPHPPAGILAEQANLRWMLGDIPAANSRMELAVKAGIQTGSEYYLRAMLLQFTARIAEAESVLLETLRRWPEHGEAAVILVNLRRQTEASNHLGLVQELLARLPPHKGDRRLALTRAKFESAAFKVLDDLDQRDEAWQALERSNALMHAFLPYDATLEESVTDALITAADKLGPRGASTPKAGPMPIFIVGMPRSGSTLLDHMLSAHSAITSAGEINDFQLQLHWMADVPPRGSQSLLQVLSRLDKVDFEELGARYLAQTQWRAGGSRYFVDKLPINIRMVPFIRRALPHAPILHLEREPMDVCYSNLKVMFGVASPYCYDMRSLAHYYGQYRRLADHWREKWDDAMLDIAYADLVAEPEPTLRRILDRCGLPFEEACLHPDRNTAAVATPSSSQVREPLHSRNLAQWKRYAGPLEPLARALADEESSRSGG